MSPVNGARSVDSSAHEMESSEHLPLVSILMPAYNVRPFIREAIHSVRRQSLSEWELLVVDDGSTDGTFDEIGEAAGDDQRILCFRNPRNEGLGRARARVLALARGRFVALMDSDDVAEPAWLATRLRQFERWPNLVGVSGSRRLIDERGHVLGRTREGLSPDALAWRLLFGNPVSQPSAVLRREAVVHAGGYGIEPFLEDWALFARLSQHGPLVQTNDLLVRYRVHTAGASHRLSRDRAALEPTVEDILEQNVSALLPHGSAVRCLAWTLFRGREAFGAGPEEARRAVAIILEALRAFVRRYDVVDRAGVAAGALRDLANVLRCDAWSPSVAVSSIREVLRLLGSSVLLAPSVAREVGVVLALPCTPAWRHRRGRTS